MKYDTSELCDIYQEDVNVVEPLFSNFGGRSSFGGQIITVKCFEDNGLLYDLLEQNGRGRVLVIDGGGSVRRALIDAELARLAAQNEWEGIVVYGAVRQVDDLEELDIGIQAIAAIRYMPKNVMLRKERFNSLDTATHATYNRDTLRGAHIFIRCLRGISGTGI